jgi:hypothetical protein
LGIALAALLAACGRPAPAARPGRIAGGDRVQVGDFVGQITPAGGGATASIGPNLATVQLNPVADGATGSNPSNTIEVFSEANLAAGGACGATAALQAAVDIVSYLPETLKNVQVGFEYINPTENKVCTALPAKPDASLNKNFGIIDYSAGGGVTIGTYSTHRAATTAPNAPTGVATWAFTHPSNQFFVWRAKVVADLRPYPALIASPYVDAATADTPLPVMVVQSDDQVAEGTLNPPSIVSSVTYSTYFDSATTQSAGDVNTSVAIDRTDPLLWGTGNAVVGAAQNVANAGRTIYVRMQNNWPDSQGFTVSGQVISPTLGLSKSFVITSPATVPLAGSLGTTLSLPYTKAATANGVQLEVYRAGGRGGSCTSVGTLMIGPVDVTANPYVIANGTLTTGNYCYHVANRFYSPSLGSNYYGSLSGYTNFSAP